MAITLSGGELALRSDWAEIARAVKDRHVTLSLLTNGTLFDEADLDEIAGLHPVSVSVSIYGPECLLHDAVTGVAGSFDRSVASLRGLRARGVRCRLMTVLMSGNAHSYRGIIALADELGCDYTFDPSVAPRADGGLDVLGHRASVDQVSAVLSHVFPEGFVPRPAEDAADRDSMVALRGNCGAGTTSAFIEASGDLYPCMGFPPSLGDLSTASFDAAWRGDAALKHRELMSQPLTGCSDCKVLQSCTVRCARLALVEDGDASGPSRRACELAGVVRKL